MSEQPDLFFRLIAWLVDQPEVRHFLQRSPHPAPDVTPTQAVPTDGPLFLSAQEAAKLLSVHPARVYDLIRAKQLPAVRFGARQIRISRQALMEWMSKGGTSGAEVVAAPLPPQPRQPAVRAPRARADSQAPVHHRGSAAPARTTQEAPAATDHTGLYIGAKQIAAKLGMPEQTVREYLRSNRMPYFKMGIRYACGPTHLAEFIAHGMTPPPEGWERHMAKVHWRQFSEKEQQEFIEAGFDPETGRFRNE